MTISRLNGGFWLVVLLATIIMFYNLGGIPLLDPDEPVYAETPKEMLQLNEYLSPRIFGEYWYDKPPMYYWLVAAAFKIFGINEFAARFPSALLGVGGVVAVYTFGRQLFNARAGLAGALILATSIEYFYLGKAAVTDITLNFCLMLSLLGFLTKRYYLMYIFAGLATVSKGPVGFLFPGAIIVLYLLATRRFSQLKDMKIPVGIVLFALTAGPWYWFMYQVHGSAFVDTFLGFNNVTRFTSPEHPEGVLWWYFIPVLILGFFPWTSIVVQSVWASLAKSNQEEARPLLFLNIWAVFIFIFFTISRTKLVSYILPMYPPLALIAGWYISRIWESRHKQRYLAWGAVLTVLSVLLIAGMLFGVKAQPELTGGAVVCAMLLGLMTLAVIFYLWRQDTGKAFWSQVVAMTAVAIVMVTMLFPAAAPYFTTKHIAEQFAAGYDGTSPIYVHKFLHPGFTFYTGFYGTELKTTDELEQRLDQAGKAYFVIQRLQYNQLAESSRQKLTVLATAADRMILLKK